MQRFQKQLCYVFLGVVTAALCQASFADNQSTDTVILTISGNLEHSNEAGEVRLDATWLQNLPRQQLTTHTSVTDGPQYFEGYLIRDVLDALGADGEQVVALALNDYRVKIPISDFQDYSVILADSMNGRPLTRRDKGPLWIVYPRDEHKELQDIRYDYRWVWQLYRLEIK